MRLGAAIILIVSLATAAKAAPTDPTIDVVGNWGDRAGCVEGTIGFARADGNLFKLIYDNGTVYRSMLKISMEGNILHLIDDEKKFSYRILGSDRIEFIGFTDLSNGLTAHTRPRTWHRCQATS